MPIEKNFSIKDYVSKTEGFTGADIESICRNAGIKAIKKHYIKKDKQPLIITKEDFDSALEDVSKSIGKPIHKQEHKDKKEEDKKRK